MSNDSKKVIKFEEAHPDVRRYLENDCYCQHEVYDVTGIFYQLFYPEDDCIVIEGNDERAAVVMKPEAYKPQAIMIWFDDPDRPGKILNMQCVDATDNNIGILRSIVKGEKPDGRKLDEYDAGSTKRSIDQIMSIADCVMVD